MATKPKKYLMIIHKATKRQVLKKVGHQDLILGLKLPKNLVLFGIGQMKK
ncbi:hypothetical protein KJ627_03145 [Patescibacteria group bacterium]|nr:hypothetical protein [Patescibacteria group bacterium]MBU2233824.1 hypothetical protein [Patescibacteria group bacterium]MBU2263737.1 hypothetical protein [Patescibacteria group bacterium]